MRIITGQYKGRIIKAPKGIRPTEDRVRKAFFDIMADVADLSFLELFAGSGAMGLEALSRGAKEAFFVEHDRDAIKTIEQNIQSLGLGVQTTVLAADVLEEIPLLSRQKRKFDLIFFDPPYYEGLAEKTLQMLEEYDILLPLGYIIIQHFERDPVPQRQGNFVLIKQSQYGGTVLSFYSRE